MVSENPVDDALPDEVVDPEVRPGDRARDDHDDGAGHDLSLRRPLDLAELGDRLADEAAALRLAAARLPALSLLGRADLRLARACPLTDRSGRCLAAARLGATHRAALCAA